MSNQKYAWMLPEHVAAVLKCAHDCSLTDSIHEHFKGIRKTMTLDVTTQRPTLRMSHDAYTAFKSFVMSNDQLKIVEMLVVPFECPPDDPFCIDRRTRNL